MNLHRRLAFAASLTVICSPARADTYGKQEHVRVMGTSVEVTATLDAGLSRSTLRALDVKYFQRDGDTWVRFTIDNGSVLPGNRATIERKVLKDVKVRQNGGGVEHRPLVEVELCLGDRSFKAMVSLSDRSTYTAPLSIGAAELEPLGSVDTARQFTHEPNCTTSDAIETTGTAVSIKP